MDPRFLYVFGESERFCLSSLPPTSADYAAAAVGVIAIIRLADLHVYSRGNSWRPIAPGVRVQALGEMVTASAD